MASAIPFTHDDVDRRFTYVAPNEERREKHERVREGFTTLAHDLVDLLPESDERDDAIKRLREAMMLANAAIATNV
jgi:hypothetical protein